MEFKDLNFKPHPHRHDGIQAKAKFANGYGASVIKTSYSYGFRQGRYELAVLNANGHLDYTTPITDDVVGWLDEEGVTELLQKIEALPSEAA